MAESFSKHRRYLLIGAGGAFALLFLGLGAFDLYLNRQTTKDLAFTRLEDLSRIAAENISGHIRAVDVVLQDVGREAQEVASADEQRMLAAYIQARAAAFKEVRAFSVTDAAGKIIFSSDQSLKGFDGSQRPYFTIPFSASDRDNLFLVGPLKIATGNTIVLFASRPKPLINGKWDGVVQASMPSAYFSSILETVQPPQGFATLIGADGTIISRSPDLERFVGTNIAHGPAHAAHMAAGKEVTRAEVETATNGVRHLVVSRTTAFPSLIVAIGWPEDVVLAEWRRAAWIKGSALLVLGLLAAFTLRRFVKHEGELLAQRNFARQLVETANVVGVGLDPQGKVRVFNEAAEAVTGYKKEEIRGHSWFEVAMAGEQAKSFLNGGPLPRQFESALRTKDGRERTISWQNSAVSGGPGIVSMSFGIDITDRLEAERELLASQRFIKAIADNMPGMVGYWDTELRCRFANKSYLEWFGKPPEQIIGRNIQDLMGDQLFAMNEPYIRAVLKGEKQNFERVLKKPNGELGYTWAHYIPDIDVDGQVVGFFVLVNDITPLKRVEAELRVTSERLALAAKAGRIGVWDYNLEDGGLVWDDRMFELYGFERAPANLTYEVWQAACLPADLVRVEAEFKAALDGNGDLDTEFRIVTPGGEIRYIKDAATIERGDDGKPRRLIGVNWDITAIRNNEKALAEARVAAEKASRAKSDFLANMSHEIRTPLNALLGLSHLLERTPLSTEQRDFTTKIKAAGRTLLSIINDILDFSKVEAGGLELEVAPFLLSDLLDAVSTIMAANASSKDLELVIGTAPSVPTALCGDALRLQQVLMNLTSNAIKFTEKGEVSLTVQQIAREGDKAVLHFQVKDSGIGITPDAIPTLFHAFTQEDSSTTRRYGGSGLGLAISKRLVELMGGKIGVESWPGKGSTFWFTIPLTLAENAQRDDKARMRGLDVLIADDHEGAREVLAVTASSLGWTPETAASGRQALERLEKRKKPFDVLVLDWKMPDMDGLAVTHAIRKISDLGKTPIVVMVTGFSQQDMLMSPGADLVDAVLVKPVTASSLLNAVMDARARRSGGAAALVAATTSIEPGQRLPQVRLLLVEDNAINQEVAKRVLEWEGAVVTIAGDGTQAIDRLAADPAAFDGVLMDVQMPVMDGYEATRQIRHSLGLTSLPVIALTAGALTSERNRAHQAGMNDFIAKPFDIDEMVGCIRKYVTLPAKPAAAHLRMPETPLHPQIPGIDMRQAALRLGSDSDLFVSLLRRLENEFSDAVCRVRKCLDDQDREGAVRLLHTLRGVAGNMAAVEVASLASEAEAAIRDGKEQEAVSQLLHRLDSALTGLVDAVRQSEPFVPEQLAPPSELLPVSQEEVASLLADLEARNMEAIFKFKALYPALCQAFGAERMKEIGRQIDGLQFEWARNNLMTLLEER